MRVRGLIALLLSLTAVQACADRCLDGRCQVAERVASRPDLERLYSESQDALGLCIDSVDPEFVGGVRPGSREATLGFRNLTLSLGEVRLPPDEHDPAVVIEIVDQRREHRAYFLRNGFGVDTGPHRGCFLRDELRIEMCSAVHRCQATAFFSIGIATDAVASP